LTYTIWYDKLILDIRIRGCKMQTKQCPYCKQNIGERGYNIHLQLCPKKPKPGEVEVPKTAVTPPVSTTNTTPDTKVEVTTLEIPAVGTAEYKEYWMSLDERGQNAELARRKAFEQEEVKPDDFRAEVSREAKIVASIVQERSENGAMEVFYPEADPHFLVTENTVEALRVTDAISHKHPTNLLVTGQPGGGKTSLAIQFAARLGRPAVVVDFGVLQEPQQLFQTTRLIQGDGDVMITDIRETGFVRGMETENCVVIMDEINRPENERVLNVLMPLLDGRRSAWIEDLRRRVNVAGNVIFIATLNEGALFCGITSIDMALRDRFREIFLDYLPANPESGVLQAKAGIPKTIANSLAEFAYVVRTTPAIGKKVSTRQLLHAAEAYSEGTSLWQAVEAAIGNYQDLAWRQQVMEVFSLNIKDEDEYKKWTNKQAGDRYVKY
jgi:MoxR-like ATPase